jgi:hypothetical protein
VAEKSNAWVYGRSLAGITGSNPDWARMSVCCECCVLSGRGLCDGPITRTEESEQVGVCVCVSESDLGTSQIRPKLPRAVYSWEKLNNPEFFDARSMQGFGC